MSQFLDRLFRTTRGSKAHLLVFGYIRNQQKLDKNLTNFLDDIIIECLKYYFQNHACDPNACFTDHMELTPDDNTVKMISYKSS